MAVEVVHFFLPAEGPVAGEGDDLHFGAHHLEGHVEPDLVVAGAGGAVGDGVGPDLLRVAGDGDGLEDALRRDGDGVGAAPEDVAVHHIFQALLIIFILDVQGGVGLGAQLVGVLFVLLELGGGEPAGVRAGGIDFMALVGQVHHGIGGVQASAVSDDDFHCM